MFRIRITEVVKQLLIINGLFFIVTLAFREGFFNIIDMDLLALFYPESENFRPYQLVTHFFMHADFQHIFFNMFSLVIFGSALEDYWGPKRFLIFYIICALGGALIHTLSNYYDYNALQSAIEAFQVAPSFDHYTTLLHEYSFRDNLTIEANSYLNSIGDHLQQGTPNAANDAIAAVTRIYDENVNMNRAVGASGAIYGLLLGFGMLFPNVEIRLIFFPMFPIKAKVFIPIIMLIEVFSGIGQLSSDNVAHFAHLGGALFGFLMVLFWRKTQGVR